MKNYDAPRQELKQAGWNRRDRSQVGKLRTKRRHENSHKELWYAPEGTAPEWKAFTFEQAWKKYNKNKGE